MFRSSVEYKNRSGVAYTFKKLSEYEYLFKIEEFGYGRMGGKEGQESVDWSDLGMFDPSGGPYIALGTMLDDREIIRISNHEDGFIVGVQPHMAYVVRDSEGNVRAYTDDNGNLCIGTPEDGEE